MAGRGRYRVSRRRMCRDTSSPGSSSGPGAIAGVIARACGSRRRASCLAVNARLEYLKEMDGVDAERVAVPRADFNLVELPGEMDFATAAGMGCRVTTAWRAVVDRARLAPGEWIVVHGCGGVGLSAVMIGAAVGAQVLAVDVNPGALELAQMMGATRTLNAEGLNDVGGAVREITGGGAQVSVEALGITATFENSLRGLAPLGRHVQIGMPSGSHATPALPLYELIYARQLQILGTRGLAASRFPALFAAIQAGRMDPSRLVTRSIALAEAPAAIAEMDGFSRVGVTVIDRF